MPPVTANSATQFLRENSEFQFFFDANNQLSKVRVGQAGIGGIDFEALKPVQESNVVTDVSCKLGIFSDRDFSTEGCDQIPSLILEEARTFVTFMSSMVEDLIGNEQVMMAIAKAQGKEYQPTIDQWAKDNGITELEDDEDEEAVG